ncbi:DUF5819 family protein [Streptomyces pseudovenezuelae]|uniref:Uncharacterized protein n=1 Tax=Streptomyces pseudovenezuelae TaxID=67350 RepID=A0ABT6LH98_9ACTN|nr:DUF5819 family protein [Streptomyces pseudovenezuelae]MDH6215006.1 hypothetical protein [Streptomyces pseudovenezuelae]
MDAYDTDSDARREPDGPGGPDDVPGAAEVEAPGAGAAGVPSAAVPTPAAPTSAAPPAAVPPAAMPPTEPRTGVAALSPGYQVAAALALAVVGVTVCVHLALVFLHVAPSNTVTKQHGNAIDDWVYPEFEQNWKLFAPNPLQQNIAVQVRAEVHTDDGEVNTTGWYDLSAEDGRAIDGNLLPSHTDQNELRRAWDFFASTHDGENRPSGLRGALSETYLRRIVVLRLDREDVTARGGVVENVQVRARTTNVPAPKWSDEKISDKPMYRVLPWWTVTAADSDGGAE